MTIGTNRRHFRRICEACLHTFTCLSAYQLHLFGRRSNGVRCRSDDEMRKIGMGRAADGAWMSRIDTTPKKLKLSFSPKPGHREPFA